MEKMVPVRAGAPFTAYFEIMRPRVAATTYPNLCQLQGQLVLLRQVGNPAQVWRGQLVLNARGQLLFLGTPWFTSMEAVTSQGLRLNDFALFDPMVDMLYTLKTQELARTDLQEIHHALTLNTQRLSQLVANLQAGVLVEDANRRIVLANQLFCDLFQVNVPPEQMVGADCANSAEQTKHLFADPEGFVLRAGQLLARRERVLHEKIRMADGRMLERDYVPIFDGGLYLGHLWQYRDITERIKADEALRRREEKYRGIIANMHLGLMEVDLADRILYINQSFCEMSGYTPEELVGREAASIFLEAEQKKIIHTKNQSRNQGISDAYEIEVVLRNGEKRWWLVSGAPLFNDAGVLIGSIGIHLDITEQKRTTSELMEAKLQAEASAKAKQQFLANMSHEIRTPMNAILGLGRQLQKKNLDSEETLYVNTIVSAAENMLVILNDVLDFSKMEAGKLTLENIDFDLRAFVEKTLLLLGPRAEEKGLALTATFDPRVAPSLQGDPYRLNQVLVNILGNAVKFTEKGSVALHCGVVADGPQQQELCFTITDTGVGIDARYLPNLFDNFSQQEQHSSRRFGGTGLGMSISHQLLTLMGGTIAVTSTLGKGTTVTIQLALRKTAEPTHARKAAPVANPDRFAGLRVLLVDDNAMNRLVARIVLKGAGMVVTEAVNGADAIKQLETAPFDVVLMDMQMPVMDGLEATRHIRKQLRLQVPVIALTANAIKGENDQCVAAGMNDYLAKPFAEQELLDKIAGQLQAAPAPASPLQLATLRDISQGDEALFNELVRTWRTDLAEAAAELDAALENRAAIRAILHRIEPGIGMSGIPALQTALGNLKAANHNAETPLQPAMATFLSATRQTLEELEALL